MTRKEAKNLLLNCEGKITMEKSSNTIMRLNPAKWNTNREINAYLDVMEAIGLITEAQK